MRKVKIVRTLHNLEAHESSGWLEGWLVRRLDRDVAVYIALNAATQLENDSVPAYIPHGHYVDRFSEHPRSKPISGRVIYFGLIKPYKNVPHLIRTFAALSTENCTLSIIGKVSDGTLSNEIRGLAKLDARVELNLDFVDDDVLVREVTAAQVVVLPYAEMHNSGVLIVALSLGKPVLAPRTPANLAIQEEVGAEWLILFDSELTADDVQGALAATARIGHLDRPDLSGRAWSVIAEAHREVYRTVVGGES